MAGTSPQKKRCALVTGAARGIGRSIATKLHADGFAVVACDLDEEGLQELEREVGDSEGFMVAKCNVTSSEDSDALASRVAEEFGAVHTLVNNAGVLGTFKLIDTTDDELERILAVNVGGIFKMTRAVLPGMLERNAGRVISMTSITPLKGEARTTAYAASKGAVIGFTKSLSREVAHRGITVNAIAPGYMLTDQTAEVFTGELGESIKSQITARRFGTPDDVAGTASFLSSDAASYMTGQVLVIDGGVV